MSIPAITPNQERFVMTLHRRAQGLRLASSLGLILTPLLLPALSPTPAEAQA